jgi:predicted transcriptional regulator YdeE
MAYRITRPGEIRLAGMAFFGDPFAAARAWSEENEIGRLWGRYMAACAQTGDGLPLPTEPGAAYEVHMMHPATDRTGEYEVFVGRRIQDWGQLHPLLLAKAIPPATYAVFTLTGSDIVADYRSTLLPQLRNDGYEPIETYCINRYDHRYKGVDRHEVSTIEVMIPVLGPHHG